MACGDTLEETDEILDEKLAHLQPEKREQLCAVILKHDIIARDLSDLRPANVPLKHKFTLSHYTPIAAPIYRIHPDHAAEVRRQLDKMLEAGVITESNSPWAFPLIMAPKKDGRLRLWVDFRKLNAKKPKDESPLPNIEEILDDLGGSCIFTTLDLFSGYWQVRLDESVKDMVCFRCPFGSYHFEIVPLGLLNAAATFQRFMITITRDLKCVRAFMDDVCAHS